MLRLRICTEAPQKNVIRNTAQALCEGAVIIYPTDAGYVFGCRMDDKNSIERIININYPQKNPIYTLSCDHISEMQDWIDLFFTHMVFFRIYSSFAPGPYSFNFKITKPLPIEGTKFLPNQINFRFPDHKITKILIGELGVPLFYYHLPLLPTMTTWTNPDEIYEYFHLKTDILLDTGICNPRAITVLDFSGGLIRFK